MCTIKNINVSEKLEKYWVVGDVHGCMFTLEELVAKLPKDSELIFVGDLIDRGYYSKEVVEFIIENNYISVLGNHEYFFIKYAKDVIYKNLTNDWSRSKRRFGGFKTIKSYQSTKDDTLLRHLSFIEKLPKYLEIDNCFITHGFGLPYYKRKDSLSGDMVDLFTNRIHNISLDWEDGWQEYKVINIFGHTPFDNVLFGDNYIGIDTGAVFGNKLSAVNLKTKEVVSQEVIRKDFKAI